MKKDIFLLLLVGVLLGLALVYGLDHEPRLRYIPWEPTDTRP